MADKKISQLTSLTSPDGSDVIPIVDVSQSETKKITFANLSQGLEQTGNKKTTLLDNSDTYYPTQKAVKTAVDNVESSCEPSLGNPSVTGYVLSSDTEGTRSWVEQSGGGGGDEKVKISSNDTTAEYLLGKLTASIPVVATETGDGGNETLNLTLDINGSSEKTSFADTDEILISDSANGNAIKKVAKSNLQIKNIEDADGDTYITTEATSDADQIEIWAGGTKRAFTSSTNTFILGSGTGANAILCALGGSYKRIGIGTSFPYTTIQAKQVSATSDIDYSTTGAGTYDGICINSYYNTNDTYKGHVDIVAGNVFSNGTNGGSEIALWTQTVLGTNGPVKRLTVDASGNVGIGTDAPTEMLDIDSDAIRVRTSQTPASATATGTAGMICWDADYIYVCVATDTWKRTAIATW